MVDGVGEVWFFGSGMFVMRVWLNLVKMVVYGVIVIDINDVICWENYILVVGIICGELVCVSVDVVIDL